MAHPDRDIQRNFEKAFFEGDTEAMAAAVSQGAQVDFPVGYHPSQAGALMLAVDYSWLDRVEALLGLGADPALSKASQSPMELALKRGDGAIVAALAKAWDPDAVEAAPILGSAAELSTKAAEMALACLPSLPRGEALDAAVQWTWDRGQWGREGGMGRLIALGADPWALVAAPEGEDEDAGFHGLDCEDEQAACAEPVAVMVGLAMRGMALDIALSKARFEDPGLMLAALKAAAGNADPETLDASIAAGCDPARFPAEAQALFDAMRVEDCEYDDEREARLDKCVASMARAGVPVDGDGGPSKPTPLMDALKMGRTGLAMELLRLGADPLAKRGGRSVFSHVKHHLGDPEFAQVYGLVISAKEREAIAGASPEPKARRAGPAKSL